LRGRKAVRADEDAIRAQSAILYKTNLKRLLLLSGTVFLLRMLFIRTENPVGARSAQVRSWHATVFKTPNGLDPP
jgi:hypothetical protein